jgi:signal transduction histidine kinase
MSWRKRFEGGIRSFGQKRQGRLRLRPDPPVFSALLDQQRRFVADAAHELRSPLTASSVQSQNLHEAVTLEAMPEGIEPLQAGIERTRKLTEQFLSLARIQAGTELTTDVDVAALAREMIANYLPLAEAKGIDLGLDELASVRIRVARDTLCLVLRNGLDNALRYTPQVERSRCASSRMQAASSSTSSTTAPASPPRSANGYSIPSIARWGPSARAAGSDSPSPGKPPPVWAVA